jgi:hypothetical protein
MTLPSEQTAQFVERICHQPAQVVQWFGDVLLRLPGQIILRAGARRPP